MPEYKTREIQIKPYLKHIVYDGPIPVEPEVMRNLAREAEDDFSVQVWGRPVPTNGSHIRPNPRSAFGKLRYFSKLD